MPGFGMDFSERITLGRSGLSCARMGIGADQGIDAKALEWAFEQGINYFYWGSQRTPGMRDAIRALGPSRRDALVIAVQSYDMTGLVTPLTFKRALRQLGIDYADVLILAKRDAPLSPRAYDTAVSLREAGLARHLCRPRVDEEVILAAECYWRQAVHADYAPMTTQAAIDRLVHHSAILEFGGRSRRADEAEQRARANAAPADDPPSVASKRRSPRRQLPTTTIQGTMRL